MTIIKRADLGRPLTWDELDDNFQQVDDLTAAASAAVSSATASATAAAGSAAASANSATDAANSAANAAAAIVSAVKSTITFTTGGTLNSNLDRISDGTYLYYWTGTYPVTVPADSTVDGTGGIGIGFWAPDTELTLRTAIINPDGFRLIGQVESWLDLQNTPIVNAGDVVVLKKYSQTNSLFMLPSGGGKFIAVAGSATDDGGTICVPTGQTDHYWLRLRDKDEIHMSEYGLEPGDEISVKLQAAIDHSRQVGISEIVFSPSYGEVYYSWSAQVNADVTSYPLYLRGGDGKNMNNVMIKHYPTTDGEVAFRSYTTTHGAAHTESARIAGIYMYNQSEDVICSAYEFSDAWAYQIDNVYITHYTKSAGIKLVNVNSWTENFIGRNINIRHCKHGFWLYNTGDWQSFYGFKLDGFYFNHGSSVGDVSNAIYLGDGTSTGYAFLYAADINMGGWLGTTYETGAHAAIRLSKYSIIMGKCRMNYDGTRQSSFGKYFRAVVTEDTQCIAYLDFTNNNDQFSYVSVQAPDSAAVVSHPMWDNIAYPMLDGEKTYGRSNWMNVALARSPIIMTGANQKWKTTVTSGSTTRTDSGVIRVSELPILSNFRVEIRTNGAHQSCNRVFTVNTHNQDTIASVNEQQRLKASTGVNSVYDATGPAVTSTAVTNLSADSAFTTNRVFCRTYNNVVAGNYSPGNGRCFDIVIPPATYNGTDQNSDPVVTSGLTTAIEIIITQL